MVLRVIMRISAQTMLTQAYASGAGASYYGIGGGINSAIQGFYQNQKGNPDVTWEKDKMTNIGLTANLAESFRPDC